MNNVVATGNSVKLGDANKVRRYIQSGGRGRWKPTEKEFERRKDDTYIVRSSVQSLLTNMACEPDDMLKQFFKSRLVPSRKSKRRLLWRELESLNAIKWSVKQQGFAIGAEVYDRVKSLPVPDSTEPFVMASKASTQADVESPWFRYWMNEIHSAPLPHRKLWEFAYILQNMYGMGVLEEGRRGIGFGCGEEPLPSYFASKCMYVTVTDLDPKQVAGRGWAESGQHTASIDSAFHPNLCDRASFDEHVELQYVDMNNIPAHLDDQYDFCWSVCALEHLGSIKQGLDFIENSLQTLKGGG